MKALSGCSSRNHTIRKYIAQFHPEEHADLVVSQGKEILKHKAWAL